MFSGTTKYIGEKSFIKLNKNIPNNSLQKFISIEFLKTNLDLKGVRHKVL